MNSIQAVIAQYDKRNEAHYSDSGDIKYMTKEELDFYLNHCRHAGLYNRVLEPLRPLFTTYPQGTWLTTGDGRYGKEAFYLQKHGLTVTATDIDSRLIAHAHKNGFIQSYDSQNVERMTYSDQSFDFVLSKNTLHHLARPYLGLYEMLRVARTGVVVIEPSDPKINENLQMQAEGSFEEYQATIFANNKFFFEECGNYIYRLSTREIEKVAFGLGRTKIAFRGINEEDSANLGDINKDDNAYRTLLNNLALKDLYSVNGFRRFDVMMAIIFVSDDIPEALSDALTGEGWQVKNLPRNPYLYRKN